MIQVEISCGLGKGLINVNIDATEDCWFLF